MKTFEIMYQAAGAGTGKNVQVDVYKPDKTKDITQSGLAEEVGGTGRYHKSFDADAPGWFVEISDDGGGKAVKHFDKDAYDAHGVADLVANVQTAIDSVNTAIGVLQTAVGSIDSKVDTLGIGVGEIRTGVGAIQTVLAAIEAKVDDLESPPMVG